MFLSAAMMLRHGLGRPEDAERIESAVERALADGLRTPDLGGSDTTDAATEAVVGRLGQG
jgi:3-isopropylmalate dehydrogenase